MLKSRIAVVAVTALVGIGLVPGTAQALPPENSFVSIGANGAMPNGRADRPQMSGNGRYVTFDSAATNIDPRDTTPDIDVYRHDLQTGRTELVSVGVGPCPTTSKICSTYSWSSDDGNLVAFASDKQILPNYPAGKRVYMRDMSAGTTEMISLNNSGQRANGPASRPMVSSTGRFVAFSSSATNLSPLGGNGQEQVYLRDRTLGTTTLISVNKDGGLAGSSAGAEQDESYRGMVSTDGSIVTYSSRAGDIVAGDSNNREDVFIRYVALNRTERVSVRTTGATTANGGGTRPYMSPDASWVLFNTADPILPDDTNGLSDVYLYNTINRSYERISVAKDGGAGTGDSLRGFISDDGRYVFFNSFSSNLADRDLNGGIGDAFVRDRSTGKTYVVSLAHDGKQLPKQSFRPVPSADGSVVTFLSLSRTVVPNDTSSTSWYQTYATKTASVLPSTGPVDGTAPTLTVGTPVAGSTNANPVTFSGTASDDVAVRSVDVGIRRGPSGAYEWLQADGRWGTTVHRAPAVLDGTGGWSLQAWANLPDGSYNANVRAFDTSGNGTGAWRGFKVATPSTDTTAPTATMDAVASPATNPVSITGTAADDVAVDRVGVSIRRGTSTSGFEYLQTDRITWAASPQVRHAAQLTARGATSTDWSVQFTLPAGDYRAEAQAWDTSGNVLATKPARIFSVTSP